MRKIALAAVVALLTMVCGQAFAGNAGAIAGAKQQQQQAALAGSINKDLVNQDFSDKSQNTVEGDDFPAAQAWAAPLVATEDTCMGSSSAGVQAASFGVSLGTTWRDGDCVRRKDARLLHNMGLSGVAAALMCQKAAVAEAFADAGVPCVAPAVQETRAAPAPVPAPVLGEEVSTNHWEYEN